MKRNLILDTFILRNMKNSERYALEKFKGTIERLELFALIKPILKIEILNDNINILFLNLSEKVDAK